MKANTQVVASDGSIEAIVDLEDFPHGELVNVRKDDQYDIEFYSVPDNLEVQSYNPATGNIEWKQVKYWSVHRGKKIEIVTLTDGSQIYTDHDPRAVYGFACDAKTTEPERFTPTDALARKVLVPIATDRPSDILADKFYDFNTGDILDHSTDHSIQIGFSFGQFVGIMAGDGWADVAFKSYIADNEGYNIDFISNVLKLVYNQFYSKSDVFKKEEHPGRYGDTTRYRLNVGTSDLGCRIKELVDGHGDGTTSGSANKRLPDWYQLGGRDFIEGLVCGLMATDGTVSVSHGKEKPQLRMQFSTTSFRLAREFQRCCRILGVRSSVNFGRNTSGGGAEWICLISTPDARRVGLLNKCCHARKRDVFMNTEVSTAPIVTKSDSVPFPSDVADEILPLIPTATKPVTEQELHRNTLYHTAYKTKAEGRITRYAVNGIYELGNTLAKENMEACAAGDAVFNRLFATLEAGKAALKPGASVKFLNTPVSAEDAEALRLSVEARKPRVGDISAAAAMLKLLYSVRKTKVLSYKQGLKFKEFFDCNPPYTALRDSRALAWLKSLADSDVRWEAVERVDKTGVEQMGYDLTVPGFDTFVNADGVVLSNTVNIHVPASDKASKEALEKMLPSKNLFSLTDLKSVRYKLEKEQVSGLWSLTGAMSGKPPRVFRNRHEAIAAYRRGEIGPNDPVVVK